MSEEYSLRDVINSFVRKLPKGDNYKQRLLTELDLIRRRKFIKVFMQVRTILELTDDIPHVIRGSAGSSLVCYLLGITDIDPILYNISLARFMHEERSDNPDIDIDFPYNKRTEVFNRIYKHFGKHRVARISNHLFFREKSALREAVRQHGYKKQYSKHDDLVEILGKEKVEQVLDTARDLYRTFRGFSLHCGGIVIFDNKIPDKLILKGNQIKLNKDQVEDRGYIKIDILSNRALAQLADLDRSNLTEYPENDHLTSELLSSGDNMGITIAESPAMRKIFTSMKPKSRMDVAFALALLRPAAAAEGNKDKILNGHDPVLVFDDDAIDRFRSMIGCTEAEADNYRRAFAKHKHDKIEELLSRVSSQEDRELILNNFKRLSLYSFCKCLDCDTNLVDPTTGESTTIEELYNNFRDFKLLSYKNGNTVPDEIVDVHFNGHQRVLYVEFDNGINHAVTEGHRFMTECGEMKTVMEIFKSGHAVRYISDSTNNLAESPHGFVSGSIKQAESDSRCYIKSIKDIGIRPTYSPEMKSEQHNYITEPIEGQVIHANSHAISYGQLVWALAYQKARKPQEFWVTALNHCQSMYRKWVFYRHAVASGLSITLGKGPWTLKDGVVIGDKLAQSGGPIVDYYNHGYWITDEFISDCYYEESEEDGVIYVKFRGLVATYRKYTGERKNVKEGSNKSYQVTFVTVGYDNDKMLDLVLYGRPKVGRYNIVEGVGIKKTWCNTTHIQVTKYWLSNP